MGFAIEVATHVHRVGDAAPGDRELQLRSRLEVCSTTLTDSRLSSTPHVLIFILTSSSLT